MLLLKKMSADSDSEIPEAISEQEKIATIHLLPAKSIIKYETNMLCLRNRDNEQGGEN